MLIDSVALEAVGPFRERLVLGPFSPGLNVLAQPNEWGKSTFVRSLCHGFFDRYGAEHEGIRRLRPAGTSLSPRMEVDFQVRGERFRLAKRFLEGRLCQLSQFSGEAWRLIGESDAADHRLRELLGAPALKAGAAKAETWGMIRYLWCRQEEPPDWPDWAGDGGAAARRKLVTVEIDRSVRALSSALAVKAETQLSPRTGKVKAGSPLDAALQAKARLEQELAALRAKRKGLVELEQEMAGAAEELPRLKAELARLSEEAGQWKSEAERVEKLQRALALEQENHERADSTLQSIRRDAEALEKLALAEAAEAGAIESWGAKAEAAGERRGLLEAAAAAAGVAHREQSERRARTAENVRAAQALLRWRQTSEEAAQLGQVRERARSLLAELSRARAARAALAVPTPIQLKQWHKLERALREDRVRLETLSLSVSLKPDAAARLEWEADGRPGSKLELAAREQGKVHASRSLCLHLTGWGMLEISSGAAEPAALQGAIAERERELAEALSAAGLASLGEGECNAQLGARMDEQIRLFEAKLSGVLGSWKSVEELELRVTALESAREQQRPALAVGVGSEEISLVALSTQIERGSAAMDAAALEETRLAQAAEQARAAWSSLAMEAAHATAQQREAVERKRGLAAQQAALVARYPEGMAAALQGAQGEFVRAEARLAEGRRQLPAEAEKIPGRAERSARAVAQVEEEHRRREAELRRLETILTERGAEGWYSRESELEEKLEQATASAAALRLEAQAARLLGELIRRREHTAIRQVLRPLEERLSAVFSGLTGVPERRVWFNEELQVEGVGRTREEMVRFDDLSRGAREQLLLGLRAAIALELGTTEGPQCLILDDVLVHTDAARHQNVLDYLQELAGSTQILLLTCHAERYRGVGQAVHPQR